MGILSRLFSKKTTNDTSKEFNVFTAPNFSIQRKLNEKVSLEEIEPTYKKKLDKSYFPGEIILLWWLDGKKPDHPIPGYFKYRYGISSGKSLNVFIKEGLVRDSSPYESLKSLKVDQLKDLLMINGLDIKGKKSELIERIIDNITEQALSALIESKTYSLSEKGLSLTKKYDYVIYGHASGTRDATITPATMIGAKKHLPSHFTNNEIAWHLLDKAALESASKREYGLLRNTTFSQAEFLKRNAQYHSSLIYWLLALTLDLSGLGNSTSYYNKPQPHEVTIFPYIFEEINSVVLKGNISKSDFDDAYSKAWNIYKTSLSDTGFLNKTNNYKAISLGLEGRRTDLQQFYKDEVNIN